MPVANYKEPSVKMLTNQYRSFHILFAKYCNSLKYIDNATIDHKSMRSTLIRMDQRELYFKVFHEMDEGLMEHKQLANLCYWLIKYRPIGCILKELPAEAKNNPQLKSIYDDTREYFIERFCLFLLDALCYKLFKKELVIAKRNREELEYSLKHTDISKEALTVIFGLIIDKQNG